MAFGVRPRSASRSVGKDANIDPELMNALSLLDLLDRARAPMRLVATTSALELRVLSQSVASA